MHLTKTLLGLTIIAVVGACAGKSSIKADSIRALPEVSMDQAMDAFQQVCINKGENPMNGAVIFDRGTTLGGRKACIMRARPSTDVDVLKDLQKRYGRSQQVPNTILTQFPDYPDGPLIYVGGIRQGAEEGTFIVGITS